ncbi:hypothetical protein VPH35_045608 [Triticum aestivum]
MDEAPTSPKWHTVVSRRRRRAPPVSLAAHRGYGRLQSEAARLEAQRRRAAFLRRFKGCCSRCLAPHHRAADCRNPVRCADCWGFGHRARDPICKGRPKPHTPPPPPPAATPSPAAITSMLPHLPPPDRPPLPPPPPLFHPPPRQLPVPLLRPRHPAVTMAYRPGEASQRPGASSTFTVSTQAMEDATRNLRASAVLVTMSEARQDINPQLVAKALERELNIPWDQMHVSKHHPEDFLVRFSHSRHRDTAVEAGAVPCRGGGSDSGPLDAGGARSPAGLPLLLSRGDRGPARSSLAQGSGSRCHWPLLQGRSA